jgi:hypothetical protein
MSIFGNLVAGWKKIVIQYLFISGSAISLFLMLYACAKDPDNLGRNLLPSSDSIYIRIDSSTRITSYTISGKRVLSSANEFYSLGSAKDSIFGFSSASILTQMHPVWLSNDTILTIDSLVLYLTPNDTLAGYYYGDTLSQMTLRIFELNQKMRIDTSYYSDINPAEYYNITSELAHTAFTPDDTLIRVKINDPGILNKFATAPDSTFSKLEKFLDQFYGLFLSVDQVTDKGGYTYFNMSNADSRLTLYYNGNDSLSTGYEMAFTSSLAAHANVFTHDYTGFPVAKNLNLPEQDTLIFIEGLAGTSGRISFPELGEWRSKGLIAINRAELVLPVDNLMYPSITQENYPPQLMLLSVGAEDAYDFIYDYRIDEAGTYFDGSFDKIQNAYVFNIGLHLQSYISGKIENSDLVIVSRKTNSAANRVILKGATSLNSPVKLKVIYTEPF